MFIFVNEMMSCKISHARKHKRLRETTSKHIILSPELIQNNDGGGSTGLGFEKGSKIEIKKPRKDEKVSG